MSKAFRTIISVKLDKESADLFELRLKCFEQVELAHRFKGDGSFLLFTAVRDENTYNDLIILLLALPGVIQVKTFPIATGLQFYPAYGDAQLHSLKILK